MATATAPRRPAQKRTWNQPTGMPRSRVPGRSRAPAAEHDVDDERSPGQRPDDPPRDPADRVGQVGDREGEADEEEHERGQQVGQELPDGVQGVDPGRAHRRSPAVVAEDDRGQDGRDDPGLVEGVGQQVRPVGEDDRDRQLDEVVVHERHEPGRNETGGDPDRAADQRPWPRTSRAHRRPRSAWSSAPTARPNTTRPVPSLSRLSPSTTVARVAGNGQPTERRDDGRRVGRRDHRPDDEGQIEPKPGPDVEQDGDERGRDEDARHGQEEEGCERPSQEGQVEPVAGLEHESRQEHDQDDFRGDDRGSAPGSTSVSPIPARRPTTTRATVYGNRSGRATIATTAATPSRATKTVIAVRIVGPSMDRDATPSGR